MIYEYIILKKFLVSIHSRTIYITLPFPDSCANYLYHILFSLTSAVNKITYDNEQYRKAATNEFVQFMLSLCSSQ
jgi:hypothetical protein